MYTFHLKSITCVNSKWTAKWLAGKNQECCQCPFGCKVTVTDSRNYDYVVTKKEYETLKALAKAALAT